MEDFVNCISINIEKTKCIRSLFQRSSCADCENVCIVKAIVFSPEASVRKSDCIKCGLCYAACKFSAINIKKDNKQLIKSTDKLKTVYIGCIFSNSDIKITCLSRITEDVLINWFLNNKTVSIKRGNCKKCKFQDTLPYFTKSLKKAIILAKALDIEPNIKIKTDISKTVYITKESLSRREIFSGIGIARISSIQKREILKESLNKKKIKKDSEYPDSADIKINDTCTLCGVCEYVCPVKAIKIIKTDEQGSLYFNPSLCVACKECENACIYGALEIAQSKVSNIIAAPHKVFEVKKKVCEICKKEFYSNDEDNLCSTCSAKEETKRNFLKFLKDI